MLVEVLQLVEVHLFLDFILDDGHHPAKGVDGSALFFGSLHTLENVPGIPNDEILFIKKVELRFVGTIGIRIILWLPRSLIPYVICKPAA